MKHIEKLIVLMGLPGSGKTTMAEEIRKTADGKNVFVIHLDEIRTKRAWWHKTYRSH